MLLRSDVEITINDHGKLLSTFNAHHGIGIHLGSAFGV